MKDISEQGLYNSAYVSPTYQPTFRKGSGQFSNFDSLKNNTKPAGNTLSSYKKMWSTNLPSNNIQLSNQNKNGDEFLSSSFAGGNGGSNFKEVKRLPQQISNLRQTFDTRNNNRIRDMISKYDDAPATKNQPIKNSNTNKYDSNNNNFTGSRVGGDKQKFRNYQLQDKLKKYSTTVDQFSNQLQNTNKMSEQIRKLKQDRRKRLQAKQKQAQGYSISSSYSTTNLGTDYKSPTNRADKPSYQDPKYDKFNVQADSFKKKKSYQNQPYTPKYEKKTYNQIYSSASPTETTSTTSYLDKYKTKIKYDEPSSATFTTSAVGDKITSKYDTSKYDKYDTSKYDTSNKYQTSKYDKYDKYTSNTTATSSYTSKSVTSPTNKKIPQPVKYVQVNNFILGKSLGQGKFGIVYQATHKPTGWLFAIKKVPKDMIRSHLMVDQFILQLKLQAYLYHENILTLFTFFDDKQAIYLVLEYMEQGTLFTHLKKNKTLPQAQVAMKIRQIASSVKYLHQNQIAHRDIKPQNIVMSHGVCKLCDFGWATICDSRRKTYCGTFDYAPPEILEGSEYDYTVDLWCLGVLTYQLLVGKAPFYHISRKQTMKKILNVEKTNIQYPETLSKNAVNFIDSLIKKDPKERLCSQMLLEHPFLKYADKVTTKLY